MSTTTDLIDALSQALPVINRHLADPDVPLNQRSAQAAIEFVRHFIESVQEHGQEVATPGRMGDFITTRWFAQLYAHVHAWSCAFAA